MQTWRSLLLTFRWCIYNEGSPAQKQRDFVPLEGDMDVLPPFLETGILRACRQSFEESIHVMYTRNVFAVIVKASPGLEDVRFRFGGYLDFSRIKRLRLEMQFRANKEDEEFPSHHYKGSRFCSYSTRSTFPFAFMPRLQSIQVYVTFANGFMPHTAMKLAEEFARCWRECLRFADPLRDLIRAVPARVDVEWGLTGEQKERGDFGGQAVVIRRC
ncbi:hypothetical protein K458DRAFT_394914 [Lentithecium fluviatile CBS 122367]|uniref:Uncharacterized protein n=1 Tax=Lentithecium fluviatile CBS 122367 TaxID=1168545 RepID=A0A6G1IKF5_9PLEO|nr:hypothetical protein K458DRAFT_394914 [Lentithecium fluviatile CBS 122367]